MQATEIKLAQCMRCRAYVWAADVAGSRVAVDPLPLPTLAAVMGTLGAMRAVYEVRHHGNKPHHLKWLGGQGTNWSPEGRTLVAAHGCGAMPGDAQPVEVPEQGPHSAPATPGRLRDGVHHPHARESGSQGHTAAHTAPGSSPTPQPHAEPATRPRSEVLAGRRDTTPMARTLKCDRCKEIVSAGEPFVAIECGQYSWTHHDYDCLTIRDPWQEEMNARIERVRSIGYDAEGQIYRKGHWGRKVENVIEGL